MKKYQKDFHILTNVYQEPLYLPMMRRADVCAFANALFIQDETDWVRVYEIQPLGKKLVFELSL